MPSSVVTFTMTQSRLVMVPMPSDTCRSLGTRKLVGKALTSTIFISALPSSRLLLMHRRQILECTPKESRTMRLASRKGFAGNCRNSRKRYANQGFGVDPLGETAKLRTVSRAKFLQGVSAGFRRFAPSSERPPFLKDSRFPPFPPFPPVVLLSRTEGGLQQMGIDDAARAEFAGAADVLGFAEGRASVTGHG